MKASDEVLSRLIEHINKYEGIVISATQSKIQNDVD